MANEEHLAILKQGMAAWSRWRERNPDHFPNLFQADLKGAELRSAALKWAHMSWADLRGACLVKADLSWSNLTGANLSRAVLTGADLTGANLAGADLSGADLRATQVIKADLSRANLTGANLEYAHWVEVNLWQGKLNHCRIHGLSSWDVKLEDAEQFDLTLTPPGEPVVTVDTVGMAQLVYLLLHDARLRSLVRVRSPKAAVIFGHFGKEGRREFLTAIKTAVRQAGCIPVLCDFGTHENQTSYERMDVLARLARFVVLDMTDPVNVPQEFAAIIDRLPATAVLPLLKRKSDLWSMYSHLSRHERVLEMREYDSIEELTNGLQNEWLPAAAEKTERLEG
ncbi:MAG: pentapeptide repeat-containing protein [Armatimonadetes bacterium]|nr:pentapeptide repeat-containing protein [Armatimonadota bacterium]